MNSPPPHHHHHQYNVPVTFKSLASHLQRYGFECYLEEITYHILYSKIIRVAKQNELSVADWSVDQFCNWISQLHFVTNEIVDRLREEEVDGFTFLQLTEEEWIQHLHLDLSTFMLLLCIRNGWTVGWKHSIDVPKGVPPGVVTGIVADLSGLPTKTARALVAADKECVSTGKGLFYGQLVVLGYREYHIEGDSFSPVGQSNEKFVLRRRQIPNGLTFVSSTKSATHRIKYSSRVDKETTMMAAEEGSGVDTRSLLRHGEFCFGPDPTTDQFQIGRLVEPHNDFVVKGPLHYDQGGQQCGPVSRLACRIVCSRLPPFRCYLLVGGFSADKVSKSYNLTYY